jgi:hypothetical protein
MCELSRFVCVYSKVLCGLSRSLHRSLGSWLRIELTLRYRGYTDTQTVVLTFLFADIIVFRLNGLFCIFGWTHNLEFQIRYNLYTCRRGCPLRWEPLNQGCRVPLSCSIFLFNICVTLSHGFITFCIRN